MKFILYFLQIFVVLHYNVSFAQNSKLSELEKELFKQYSQLKSSKYSHSDSLEFYSNLFSKNLENTIKNDPTTLHFEFKKLINEKCCFIYTSKDKNFRVYSWDLLIGGTMHYYKTMYQYRANNQIFTLIPEYDVMDSGTFCSEIFTVKIRNQTYYLLITNGIYSSQDASQSVSAFTIKNKKIIDTVKLFKTKKEVLHEIIVPFNFFSVIDRPERPLKLITYDEGREIISIPVVDKDGRVTKKNILYQLKGDYFEFLKIEEVKYSSSK
jgi:hypothetical protein